MYSLKCFIFPDSSFIWFLIFFIILLDENKTKLVSQQILCCHNDVLVNKRKAEEWMAVCVCVCVRRDDLFFI